MKPTVKIKIKSPAALLPLLLILVIMVSCFNVVRVHQPSSATVGEEITVTLDVEVTDDAGSTLIFGFCAPRSWKASLSTSVSFTSSIGNSTMSLIDPNEVDVENKRPWAQQITDRVGFGGNYGEMEWIVFKADNSFTPPSSTSEDDPVTGTITLKTTVGESNVITQLGYFLGEADWGYLNDDGNSTYFFEETCLEVSGASGQPQDLCGPAPRKLLSLETYDFNDLLIITFDAQEDSTELVGATDVYLCAQAISADHTTERCEKTPDSKMMKIGPDLWQLAIWPPSYFNIDGTDISELLLNFQDATGQVVVRNVSGRDFQLLPKCF
ncbi:MAG: DUF4961 domain-containing protein [Saprospiraceae bacterium]|nr:DUF4961 domain-containing protein [Saprospiraceae bacterium]